MIRTACIFALAGIALLATSLLGSSASADSPHPGLSFAIGVNSDGDADNDCGTGVPTAVGNGAPDSVSVQVSNTTCTVREDATFKANVYLMANGSISSAGMAVHLTYTGVTSTARGDSVWDGCSFEGSAFGDAYENTGCAIGLPPATPIQVVGLIATFTFRCSADGSISLVNALGHTAITD
jgi:hypothetical protein